MIGWEEGSAGVGVGGADFASSSLVLTIRLAGDRHEAPGNKPGIQTNCKPQVVWNLSVGFGFPEASAVGADQNAHGCTCSGLQPIPATERETQP